MAALARARARLPPLATLGSQGFLGRQGRQRARDQTQRTLQAPDLGDLPGRLCSDVADPILWRGPPALGFRLPAPRQRLAQFACRDRAPDARSLARDAAEAD